MVNRMKKREIGYEYQYISDLPENWKDLKSSELEGLANAWLERKNDLKDSEALKEFTRRLVNTWSIETGILERLYDIDTGITMTLVEKGLESSLIPHGTTDKPPELVARILNDHKNALEGMFQFVNQNRQLTEGYIHELHRALTQNQETTEGIDQFGRIVEIPLVKGAYKRLPNNPVRPDGKIHEYCPEEHVGAQMAQLVMWHQEHQASGVAPEIEAAWLHHRFTQIHPYQDGNGRVARALASLVFLRASWFPLVVERTDRDCYIEALENADHGQLIPLVVLFSQVQKRTLTKAQTLAADVLTTTSASLVVKTTTDAILDSIGKHYTQKASALTTERLKKLVAIQEELAKIAVARFEEVSGQLLKILQADDKAYGSWTEYSNDQNDNWYYNQIIEMARVLAYFADIRDYRRWVRLKIKEQRQAYIVLSFHSLGAKFVGIGAVSAFLEFRDKDQEGQLAIDGPFQVCREVFQFSYSESEALISNRFSEWLEMTIAAALAQWKRQLGEG